MIFVTVGSQKFPFNRLLEKVDQMASGRMIHEDFIVQTGYSDYVPCHCRHQAFFEKEAFESVIEECDIIITHGGTGTIVDAVKRGKKTIVVPRLARYGEHVDDHQLQLPQRFHEMNLVYACPDADRLPEALEAVRNRRFDAYHSNTEAFVASVDEFIRSL